jgi:hypothetical protein
MLQAETPFHSLLRPDLYLSHRMLPASEKPLALDENSCGVRGMNYFAHRCRFASELRRFLS